MTFTKLKYCVYIYLIDYTKLSKSQCRNVGQSNQQNFGKIFKNIIQKTEDDVATRISFMT